MTLTGTGVEPATDHEVVVRVANITKFVRRHQGRRRRVLRRARRRDPRRHRPQRVRQDDAVQLRPRPVPPGPRSRRAARRRRQPVAAPPAGEGRAWPARSSCCRCSSRCRCATTSRPRRRSTSARSAAVCSGARTWASTDTVDRLIERFRLGPPRRRAGRQPELRPAEAAGHGDGVRLATRRSCSSTSPPAASTSRCSASEGAHPGPQRERRDDLRRRRAQHGVHLRAGAPHRGAWTRVGCS